MNRMGYNVNLSREKNQLKCVKNEIMGRWRKERKKKNHGQLNGV